MFYGGIPLLYYGDEIGALDKLTYLDLTNLGNRWLFQLGRPYHLYSGETPGMFNGRLVVPPCRFYWLTHQRPMALI